MMIIQCTACDKKFSVPDTAITSAGRLVQCSSCGNKWTQYPTKTKKNIIKPITPSTTVTAKKISKKRKGPIPYSKEYMQQKWGSGSIKNYVEEKGLTKKSKKIPAQEKKQKGKSVKNKIHSGFGFFNYIITVGVMSTFFIGILSFERSRLSRKFPFLEPYIDNFFETLDNFKIFILDFYK